MHSSWPQTVDHRHIKHNEHTLHSAVSEVTESKEEVVGEEKMLEKENVSKGAH